MTLENIKKLLKHYQELADGTIEKPFGHKNWSDVVHNAKIRATEMEKRVAYKSSDEYRTRHNLPLLEKPKSKEKKDGNKSKG